MSQILIAVLASWNELKLTPLATIATKSYICALYHEYNTFLYVFSSFHFLWHRPLGMYDPDRQPSNCICKKELSHGRIKLHAMIRALTFGKGLCKSEVVYWSKLGCIPVLMWIMFMFICSWYVTLFTVLHPAKKEYNITQRVYYTLCSCAACSS